MTAAQQVQAEAAVRLDGITKSFAANPVLRGVSLDLRPGEVHVLAGENGAGKSTLIKVLTGIHAPDDGQVVVDGAPVRFAGPGDARRRGLAVIHQELSLVPELTVADNLVLGREPRRRAGRLDRRAARAHAVAALDRVGAAIDPGTRVAELNTGQQQLVEIARALAERPRVLVLDEPTAALSDEEARTLLRIVAELRDEGLGLLYISHRMAEITAIADRVTVLRDGCVAGTMTRDDLSEDRIVTAMVGRVVENLYQHGDRGIPADIRLRVEGLTSAAVRPCSFDVRAGEVVGLAGIVGAGRSELCRLVAGFDRPSGGQVTVDGRVADPSRATAAGIVMLPESRKTQGLFLQMSIGDNVCLGTDLGRRAFGRTSAALRRQAARGYAERMRIKATGLDQRVGELSGGNQQKVLLARCLARRPSVLILDEPTRGVDIGAKADIYELVNEAAAQGVAVVLISSELPEVLGLADRVLVMSGRAIVAELAGTALTEENVIRHATGRTEPLPR
ncbi:sugar ABC transporter ATP-binding protein [Amycolatopsis jejuensis]|uniref:sugar ABC transporter ATP-binding protein n=1 Tax=Amycolatopsis jejuensis TaxID=330084 RepID=UPI000527140E|nr:sugar ABC transporter ATP-binding protein [Amycolatopsis jejuensis]